MHKWVFLLLFGLFSQAVNAADETLLTPEPAAESAEKAVASTVSLSALDSPLATVETFLHAMNDIKRGDPGRIDVAISTLDLSQINAIVREERGRDLAWMLLEVMDRTRVIDLDNIPDHIEGNAWVFQRYDKGVVRIHRVNDGRWLFDPETIARLPIILDDLSNTTPVLAPTEDQSYLPFHLRVRKHLPEMLKQTSFMLENWRWLALLIIVALGLLADRMLRLVLRRLISRWLRRQNHEFDDVEDKEDRLRPLGLMAMALVWWLGISMLGLPEMALVVLLVAVKFLASVSGVWAAYRLVDIISAWLTVKAAETENKIDDVLVPLIPRTLKIFVTVIGMVFIADNLNIDISGLLAGLGLGGLAFALAAKDMVQNLFGSITVLLDRTFIVGDWIRVGDQEGTVEHMGFRSTRIRTFYNSVVTVPNSQFITAEVDNMGERRFRRYSTKFGIAYDTPPDRIEAFCEALREVVRQHPYMRKDYFHVYLNDLGGSALEIMIYVFWETPDWGTELRERHRFLLDCLRVAQKLGVEYAFPTQTLYLRQDEGAANVAQEQARDTAMERGREIARDIVSQTTGSGV